MAEIEVVDTQTGELIPLNSMPVEAHEAAEKWPVMTPEEFAALVADIQRTGLQEPIKLFDGKILDGRSRLKACAQLEIEPHFEIVSGNPWTFARTMNRRRDLSEVVRYLCERAMDEGEAAWNRTEQAVAAVANNARSAAAVAGRVGRAAAKFSLRINDADSERDRTAEEARTTRMRVAEEFGVGRAAVEKGERIRRFDGGRYEPPVRLRTMKPTEALRQIKKAEVAAKVLELPDDIYRVIYIDPPWQYNDARQTGDHRESTGALHHYSTMPLSELKELDVGSLAAEDSVLLCWATFPLLPDALDLVKTWGFTYKTAFVWDKGHGAFGSYHDAEAELLLIATCGSCTPDIDEKEKQIQRFQRGRHSAKPDEWRYLIDRLWPNGPRIEMFCRGAKPDHWDTWGAEAELDSSA